MKLRILLAALLTTTSLFAADSMPAYQQAGVQTVGISGGVAKPSGEDVSDIPLRFNYGVEYNYSLMSAFSVGAFASRNKSEIAFNSPVDFTMNRFGLDFRFSPFVDTFFSLRGGVALLEASTNFPGVTLSDDATSYFVAPGFGIVFPITEKIQLVPSIHYSLFFKNKDMPKFQTFDAMGTIRYVF